MGTKRKGKKETQISVLEKQENRKETEIIREKESEDSEI